MNKWTTVLALAAVLAFAGVAEAAKANKPANKTTANKATKAKSDKPLHGQISGISADKDKGVTSITVSTGTKKKADQTVTITADAGTTVTIDGQSGKLADLKSGEYVTVSPATGKATTIAASTTGKTKANKADKAAKPKKAKKNA